MSKRVIYDTCPQFAIVSIPYVLGCRPIAANITVYSILNLTKTLLYRSNISTQFYNTCWLLFGVSGTSTRENKIQNVFLKFQIQICNPSQKNDSIRQLYCWNRYFLLQSPIYYVYINFLATKLNVFVKAISSRGIKILYRFLSYWLGSTCNIDVWRYT